MVDWKLPSERVQDLIRQGVGIVLNLPSEWLDELDAATMVANPSTAGDPDLVAATSRTNRSNLMHWAAANLRNPGAPVSANLGPEPMGIARDLVRRGFDALALDAYRMGQNVAWRRWMDIAFGLTSDPAELHELLDVTAHSISSFVDATIAGISDQIEKERDELTRGTHAERREVVALILDGAPITVERAESRLGYRLRGPHTAAVIWTDDSEGDLSLLDRAVEVFGHAARTLRPLAVIASTGTRWAWVPGRSLDVGRLRDEVGALPGVRIAVGPLESDMEGFRRSHLDAITTQRMLARLRSRQRVALFGEVELVALITHDPDRADEFIKHTLGALESAPAELQSTVLAFVNAQCNASRAAEQLFTHRNTLLRRLARADELLPRPLEENSVHVAVALEALRWRGA